MTKHRKLIGRAGCLHIALSIPLSALAVPNAPALHGVVTDRHGHALEHADVRVQDAAGNTIAHAQTGPDGRFEVGRLASGTYALSIDAKNFSSNTRIETIAAGKPLEIDIALEKGSALDVDIDAQRLDRARNGFQPDIGASVYRVTQADIDAMPQGQNTPLNEVLLQMPGVANDSYGQLHVRGDHADLQYRINGILIPEPISGFGQSFDSRIVGQLNLVTGALPAEYGYRTAGIVDIKTKAGDLGQGGSIDVYGGSHQTLQQSADVFGSQGPLTYYFSGSHGVNNLGIESPTASGSPPHDHTQRSNGFGYMSYIVNPLTRVSVMFGTSTNWFQLPNAAGLPIQYSLQGVSSFDSTNLNETQSELNNFAVIALQGTNGGKLDYQIALSTRYSRTQFNPDPIGDLSFNGVASSDFHSDQTNGLQTDFVYRLNDKHTVRAGVMVQQEHADFNHSVSVFPVDANGNQTSDVPFGINDSSSKSGYLYSAYLQDEWKLTDKLTLNYGMRYDKLNQYVDASQLSPRIGLVYQPTNATTLHAGYARYFTPPSFELVAPSTIGLFNGTTNQSAGTQNDPVKPERAHYFDVGIEQKLTQNLTVGLDAYYKIARDLLDEGQFGTALIFTPFNYRYGRVYGAEFTASYKKDNVSAYLNIAYSRAQGKNVQSAQFNFEPDELSYIAGNWVFLDHDQRLTASFGGAYTFGNTTLSADGIVGSGLRSGFANTDKEPFYAQLDLGAIERFNEPYIGKFSARLVLVNAFNRVYQLRSGSGIGVQAPQFGPQRAIYAGLSKMF